MALTQVLSIASIILGIYIIGVFFFGSNQQQIRYQKTSKLPQFHLGCFMRQHNLSHSMKIQKFINELSTKNKNTPKYLTNHLANDLFQNKAIQVAKKFETFMQESNLKRLQMQSFMQLSKATRKAFQEYQYCSQVVKNGQNIEQTHCRNIWIEFQNCSKKLEILKEELINLFDKRLETDFQAKQMLFKINTEQKQIKNRTKQFQIEYYLKEKELEVEEKGIQSHLSSLKDKISTLEYSYGMGKNETLHAAFLYKQCVQNRKQFKLCQQLSQEVRTLGHVSLESLWTKVDKKRNYIIKIQNMINNQYQNNERARYETLKNKSLDEYKKLHRIYIETKTKMNKSCGCTQAQEQRLFEKLQDKIKNQQKLKESLSSLKKIILQQSNSLNIMKEKRPFVLKEFQQKIKNSSNTQNQGTDLEEMLKKIIKDQKEINKKIVEQEIKFKDLSVNCDSNRNELWGYLDKISFISDCRLKRGYYLGLDQNLKKQKKRLNLQFRNKYQLIQALKDFKLPSL